MSKGTSSSYFSCCGNAAYSSLSSVTDLSWETIPSDGTNGRREHDEKYSKDTEGANEKCQEYNEPEEGSYAAAKQEADSKGAGVIMKSGAGHRKGYVFHEFSEASKTRTTLETNTDEAESEKSENEKSS